MQRLIFVPIVLLLPAPLACCALSGEPGPKANQKAGKKQHLEVDLGGGVKMKLVRIEPGKFMMGSPQSEQDSIRKEFGAKAGDQVAQERQHEVEITRPFYMGVYSVTQGEYEKLMGKNPSFFSPNGRGKKEVIGLDTTRFPVENLSWEDAMEFCRKLSLKEGKTFDLPTEAEWEYACRAGSTAAFHFGGSLSTKQANFSANLQRTTPVGSYEPNDFGLYDMHGNVSQFCKDWYKKDYYGESPPRDPQGPAMGKFRVVRGGNWLMLDRYCRSAYRNAIMPAGPGVTEGFRVVLRLP